MTAPGRVCSGSAFRKPAMRWRWSTVTVSSSEVNGAFARPIGRGQAELLGRPLARFVVGRSRFSAAARPARVGVVQFTGNAELLHADGGAVEGRSGTPAPRLVLPGCLSGALRGPHRLADGEPGSACRTPFPTAGLRGAHDARARGRGARRDGRHLVWRDRRGGPTSRTSTVRTHVAQRDDARLGARSRAHPVAKALAAGTSSAHRSRRITASAVSTAAQGRGTRPTRRWDTKTPL